jgi:hypothetical protein
MSPSVLSPGRTINTLSTKEKIVARQTDAPRTDMDLVDIPGTSASTVAPWGARRPDRLAPIADLSGWHIDSSALAEIDRILSETIVDAVGPEFMAPPDQLAA